MEESPQHIRLVVTEARQLWQDFIGLDTSKIGECEFYLISEMSSQLIVHQPYRTLTALRPELSMTEEDYQMAKSVINDHYMTDLPLLHPPHIIAMVGILLALVLRPAAPQPGGQNSSAAASAASGLAAAQAALQSAHLNSGGGLGGPGTLSGSSDGKDRPQPETRVHRVQMFVSWLSDSNIDVTAMVDATQEIISYYACYETEYNDKNTKDQIHRFVKARHLDK
jgi:cyclin C